MSNAPDPETDNLTVKGGRFGETVIAVFPKNDATEIRLATKGIRTRSTGSISEFVDVREYWFKDGPMAEPVPTKKGAMIPRRCMGQTIRALVMSLRDEEMLDDDIAVVVSRLDKIKPATAPKPERDELDAQQNSSKSPPPDFDDESV